MRGLSLFSGIGGLDLAFEWAGGMVAAMCEIEPYCRKVLQKHWPDVPLFEDVRRLKAEDVGTVDIIYGGFPCQPFSVAGDQKGRNDHRYLWPEFSRLVEELKPRWGVGENVPGILRLAADEVCADLERQGYEVGIWDYEAAAVGAPHRRERFFFVAHAGRRAAFDTERSGGEPVSHADSAGREEQEQSVSAPPAHAAPDNIRGWGAEPGVGRIFDGLSEILDGGRLNDDAKARAFEILRNLRPGTLSEAIQWTLRRFHGVSKSEVLFAFLCEYEEGCYRSGAALESGANEGVEVRNLWRTIEFARSSHRREYSAQYAREYSNALCKLSCEAPSLMPQAWENGCWEDGIPRAANNIPHRVDRLRALGNAVVPRQAYPIFRAIIKMEQEG